MSAMDGYFLYIAARLDKLRQGGDAAGAGNWAMELRGWPLWRAVIAEFLATFLFVFIGTMSAVDIVPAGDLNAKFVRVSVFILFSFFYINI